MGDRERKLKLAKAIQIRNSKSKLDDVRSAKGSVFEDEVRQQNLPEVGTGEQVLRSVANIGTFGTQPYISAAVSTPFNDQSYMENVYDEQLRNEASENPYITYPREALKIARDVFVPVGKVSTVAKEVPFLLKTLNYLRNAGSRSAIPAMTGFLEKAGQSDITSEEGFKDSAMAGAINLAGSEASAGVFGGAKKLFGLGEAEKHFAKQDLIDRFILSEKNRNPEARAIISKNKDKLISYSKEGVENVNERLGKPIKQFRNSLQGSDIEPTYETISKNTVHVPKAIQSLDQIAEPGKNEFVDLIRFKIQNNKSPKDILEAADKIDNELTSYYNKMTSGGIAKMPPEDKTYLNQLKNVRNILKDSIRSPESDYGIADKTFSEFQEMKPVLKDIKKSRFKYETKDNPVIEDASSEHVYPTKAGVLDKAQKMISKQFYAPGDELSGELMRKAPDPYKLMDLPEDGFTQSKILRPWVGKTLDAGERGGRAGVNLMNRAYYENEDKPSQRMFPRLKTQFQQATEELSQTDDPAATHYLQSERDPTYRQEE